MVKHHILEKSHGIFFLFDDKSQICIIVLRNCTFHKLHYDTKSIDDIKSTYMTVVLSNGIRHIPLKIKQYVLSTHVTYLKEIPTPILIKTPTQVFILLLLR